MTKNVLNKAKLESVMTKRFKVGSIFFLCILILLPTVSAATISGTVYNLFLDELDKAIISINTIPEQTMVSNKGTYKITAPPGTYTLTAFYEKQDEIYFTEEEIIIQDEGIYTIDLILVPQLEGEFDFDEDEEDIEIIEPSPSPLIMIIVLSIIVLMLLYVILVKKHFIDEPEPEPQQQTKKSEKKDLEKLLKALKEGGGRMTQKELRKKMKDSEAKISLMLTDLEAQGKIRKIKKGRGNVIILN
jgi:uncharacterized membrane protein